MTRKDGIRWQLAEGRRFGYVTNRARFPFTDLRNRIIRLERNRYRTQGRALVRRCQNEKWVEIEDEDHFDRRNNENGG